MGCHKYATPNFSPDIYQTYLLLGQMYMGRYLDDDSALLHIWNRNRFREFSHLSPFSGRMEPQNRRELPGADCFIHHSRSRRIGP